MLGEIRAVAFSFAPANWAICDGSLLQVRSNTALFALLGSQYGGDGVNTFALPDLRGRAIVDAGAGSGLSPYTPGTMTGTAAVTLTLAQMPVHTHTLSSSVNVNPQLGNSNSPGGNYLSDSADPQYGPTAGTATMAANSVKGSGGMMGGNQAHENRQPFLVLNYIIALRGIFPQRP